MENSNSPLKLATRIIVGIGGIVGVIASTVTVMEYMDNISKLELTVDTRNVRNTSDVYNLYNLDIFLPGKSKKIDDVDIAEVVIQNTGEDTIFGEGPKKNIIRNSFLFEIPYSYKILTVREFDNSVPITIKDISNTKFNIEIPKLEKDRRIYILVYAKKTNKNSSEDLNIYSGAEDLVEGNIITTQSYKDVYERNLLYKLFGHRVYEILIFIGISSLIISTIFYIIILTSMVIIKLSKNKLNKEEIITNNIFLNINRYDKSYFLAIISIIVVLVIGNLSILAYFI